MTTLTAVVNEFHYLSVPIHGILSINSMLSQSIVECYNRGPEVT